MKELLRLIYPYVRTKNVGGEAPPMPESIVRIIKKVYPIERQLGIVAYILKGRDITTKAPNELGCAETVSRIIRVLHPDFKLCIGTQELCIELDYSPYFRPTNYTGNGTIHLAETGRGKYPHGHVGVEWNRVVYSNNSLTGNLDGHMSVSFFNRYYFVNGKFPEQYYKLIA